MLDASGQLLGRSGRYLGNSHAIGTFDECMPLRVDVSPAGGKDNYTFSGKYFLGKMYVLSDLGKDMAEAANRRQLGRATDGYDGQDVEWHDDYGIKWEEWGVEDPLIQDLITVGQCWILLDLN